MCEEGGAGDAHKLEMIRCKEIRKEMAKVKTTNHRWDVQRFKQHFPSQKKENKEKHYNDIALDRFLAHSRYSIRVCSVIE